eukprot:CAMPEP_0115111774 /NCGR_PEP_ID=MMETSP0227-20121206/40246_1 /TAXON_ID=89957 /ORGANISM="Polarella glacialis, Strain CCMP 1383" /LENGTH=242 /DNA_ID=CAMNT_0002511217 /DNA_START=27 /DNA_END=755 /DNA_ORIENTATION=-
MTETYRNKTRNVVLTKDDVGKTKPTCYNLPPSQHAYGRSDPPDVENAQEVTMTWAPHVPTPSPALYLQDFRKINKMGTKSGVANAKQLAEFRKGKDVRVTPRGPAGRSTNHIPSHADPSHVYGVKGKPGTPINNIVGGHFAKRSEEAILAQYQYYAEQSELPNGKHRIKLTKAAGDRIHEARMRRADAQSETPREAFKMSKFKKVSPRLKLRPLNGPQEYESELDSPGRPLNHSAFDDAHLD